MPSKGSKQPASKYTEIKESMYYKSAVVFPCLKGPAAQIKDITKLLLDVCTKHLDQSIKQRKEIAMALKALAIVEDMLAKHAVTCVVTSVFYCRFRKPLLHPKCQLGKDFKSTDLANVTLSCLSCYYRVM